MVPSGCPVESSPASSSPLSESEEEEEPLASPPAGAEVSEERGLASTQEQEEEEEEEGLDPSGLVREIRESIQSGLLQRELQKRLLGKICELYRSVTKMDPIDALIDHDCFV